MDQKMSRQKTGYLNKVLPIILTCDHKVRFDGRCYAIIKNEKNLKYEIYLYIGIDKKNQIIISSNYIYWGGSNDKYRLFVIIH